MNNLCQALAYIIGCSVDFANQISNFDNLRWPYDDHEETGNWIQCAMKDYDNITHIFWALCENVDMDSEPYDFSDTLMQHKITFLKQVKKLGVQEYLRLVEHKGWKNKYHLTDFTHMLENALVKYEFVLR